MNKKIRALQLIDSLHVGGAEVLAVNIANALSNEGVESHLCVTRNEGPLKENIKPSVGYLFLERKKTIDITAIKKLKNYIKKNNISIIHAHSTSYFLAICVNFIYPKLKIIWHDHYGKSESLKNTSRLSIQLVSFLFNGVISVNSILFEWSTKYLMVKRVYFLNNFPLFVDLNKTTFLKGEKGKRIIQVAGFRPQKNHINLLKAFNTVLKDEPNHTLHLIGKIDKSLYSNNIKGFLRKHNLLKHVFLYDACSDIKNILNQADIGVLSSDSEGLPISLLEYGLAKLPVVVTDVGDCARVVKNNTVVVPAKKSDTLANAIISLINDKVLREKVASELHAEVLNNYSRERSVKKIMNIYKELLC
jgi:glycosyltransferase involved in cell wall biosynthesis